MASLGLTLHFIGVPLTSALLRALPAESRDMVTVGVTGLLLLALLAPQSLKDVRSLVKLLKGKIGGS